MYIISGKHRGRKIESYEDKGLRPTSSKTRAAVFNILTHGRFYGDNNPLLGAHVLDLFSGTGAMGLEALSRGAEKVTFVDQSAKSISTIRVNAEKFGEIGNVSLIVSDSTKVNFAGEKVNLVFMDPPYKSGLAVKAINNLLNKDFLDENAVIVVEVHKSEKLEIPERVSLIDERIYGETKIIILENKSN